MSSDLLKSADVAKKLNIGYSTFRKEIKLQPDFPKPVKYKENSHPQWRERDIDDYINRKSA